LKEKINDDPEDDIMNFGSYYNDRGDIDQTTLGKVVCNCGSTAFSFLRRGHLPVYLNVNNLLCLRCGDKDFRLENAPILECTSKSRIKKGESLEIGVDIKLLESGPAQVGLFVPSYLRDSTGIEPLSVRLSSKPNVVHHIKFTIAFSNDVYAQAYYYTVFCVQNLALSTCRQHFGIEV
jgi:hypothetical protein